MNTISPTERAFLAVAASAVSAISLAMLASTYLPADRGVELSRGQQLLDRSAEVRQATIIAEKQRNASVTIHVVRRESSTAAIPSAALANPAQAGVFSAHVSTAPCVGSDAPADAART